MKVDFAATIKDIHGVVLKEGQDDMTLGNVVCTAMLNTVPEDRALTADQKMQMFRAAESAAAGGVQDLSVEAVAAIKDRIGKLYGALIVGRCFDLLEQKEMPDAKVT